MIETPESDISQISWAASMNTLKKKKKKAACLRRSGDLHLTDPSVSRPAGFRRSFRLGKKSSWVRQAAGSKRWSTGVNGSNPPPAYREVIPYRRDPEDGARLVVLVGGYELQERRGWKHLWKETAGRTGAACFPHSQTELWSSAEVPLVQRRAII